MGHYERSYNNLCMASRGNDAFPTEEEWKKIGAMLSMSYLEAMTDIGLETLTIDSGGTGAELGDTSDPTPIIDMVAVFEANLI